MSKAIIEFPEAINVTGRRGRSFYALEAPPAADLGYEDDGAVDVLTGAVYVRGAIAWTETGENFFAGALAAGELAAEKADAAAGSAVAAAGSKNAAADSAAAAAASALAASGSENAAGGSATAAAASAGAAATSETNAGDSETAAAASASAADADATQTAADVLSTASNLASTVAAKDLAIAAQGGAETAQAGADATKAAMDVALAAVTDYSDTLGLLAGGAKETLVSASVLANRLYATRHDSDGGGWRKKVRWLTMPANMSIVTLAASVSLYSEDVKAATLVKSWTISGATTARAMNGRVAYSSATGVYVIDLVTDEVWRFSAAGLAKANQRAQDYNQGTATFTVVDAASAIVSNTVNAIDLAVLPGTPVDPARGLPNPTVAVATAGGVSVIHWDGRVWNSSTTNGIAAVRFTEEALYFTRNTSYGALWRAPFETLFTSGFGATIINTTPGTQGPVGSTAQPYQLAPIGKNRFAVGGASIDGLAVPGLGIYELSPAFLAGSARALITAAYNTGHMLGDIKLALAESTADLTSLVASGDLVTNGNFATNDLTGWTNISSGTGSADASSGAARLQGTDTSNRGWISQSFATTTGKPYSVTFEVTADAGGIVSLGVASSSGAVGTLDFAVSATGVYTKRFIAPASTTHVSFRTTGATDMTVDNVTVQIAASDRSVANNGAVVKGTITRTAVASGAELAAHGGFSAANYLEVPYTSAFSFGTGDFAICGWLNLAANSAIETLVERDSGTTAQRWTLQVSAAGLPQWIVDDGTTTVTSAGTVAIDDARWHFVVAARRGANQELWIDGALVDSDTAPTLTLNNASAALRVGESVAGGAPLTNGSLALLRIGATAPTPAQIRAIYEDERRLFDASAKCLLPGASVSALAYDDSTDLLHVATTAGSARMRGLLVVDKDAAVYTGIDARDGILATRDSGSADIVLPSIPLREAAAAGIGHNGGPALYDRRTARASGVTTNATPTVIARFPMDKGEFGQWVIRTVAREYDGGAELAAYEDVLLARRPGEGNLAVSGSVTQRVVQEVTSSMAVSIAANTTTQCIEVTATGVAAKNIEWTVEGRLA